MRRVISVEEREDAYAKAEAELIRKWRADKDSPVAKALMRKKPSEGQTAVDLTLVIAKELAEHVLKEMARVREVTDYKKDVNSTTQKALRKVASLAESAVKIMWERTRSEETRCIQVDNDNLRRKVALLRGELAELKRQLAKVVAGLSPAIFRVVSPRKVIPANGNPRRNVDSSDDEMADASQHRGSDMPPAGIVGTSLIAGGRRGESAVPPSAASARRVMDCHPGTQNTDMMPPPPGRRLPVQGRCPGKQTA